MDTKALVHLAILLLSGYFADVGCDDVVGSGRRRDACGVCGGDNSTCRVVSGLFTRPQLPVGYNLIAQIPRGACNVNVTEMQRSRNYLALRASDGSYIVNGNWAISWSGVHSAAGTQFHYQRQDQRGRPEAISAPGPLTQPVDLMVIYQQPNPGIKYEYMLPVTPGSQKEGEIDADDITNRRVGDGIPPEPANSHNPGGKRMTNKRRPKGKFGWKITSATSPCSKSCGGGVQSAMVSCVKESTSLVVQERKCRSQEKPVPPLLGCNLQPCPESGDSSAKESQPAPSDGVRKTSCPERKTGTPDNGDPELCPQADRPTVARGPDQLAVPELPPVWLFTEWSQECSEECGRGVQSRLVRCSTLEGGCDASSRPEISRHCSSDRQCRGQWFAGPWTQCSSLWCGQEGRQRRQVVCVSFLHGQLRVSLDTDCTGQDRPETERPCRRAESECREDPHHWFRSEWADCSEPCGVGVQKRDVHCMGASPLVALTAQPADHRCPAGLKPQSRRPCNTQPCTQGVATQPHDNHTPGKDVVGTGCVDKFRNCHLVVQARLCRYKYYKTECCSSCLNAPANGGPPETS